jgi:HTH-type transcriptional regulator/antitoxin HigA
MSPKAKPICSKSEHEAALREIDRLWNAEVGTPEGDHLDELVTQVEAYEDEHYPMGSTDKPAGNS